MTRAGNGIRVLVVDDDPSMGETLVHCLDRSGFEATSCISALAALALIDSSDFDVVVTDLNMDDMNGLALCKRLGLIRPGLPVIVTTGFGAPDARIAAGAAGAFDFLTKPIDLALLSLTIDRAAGRPPPV